MIQIKLIQTKILVNKQMPSLICNYQLFKIVNNKMVN